MPYFNGCFDGNGYTISHLHVSGGGQLGLFGHVGTDAVIRRLVLKSVVVHGSGGNIGGMAGRNEGNASRCSSSGTITGGVYAAGVGGLVGRNEGSISESSSSGEVSGWQFVGGLAGYQAYPGCISNTYSTCQASGASNIGGLMGCVHNGEVRDSYSIGTVSGENYRGGLIGRKYFANITNSFWNTQTSGLTVSAGGTGLRTSDMQNIETYLNAGWDFVGETVNGPNDLWTLHGRDYPLLAWQAAGPSTSMIEDFENGLGTMNWQLGGWPQWTVTSSESHSGSCSAQAGAINDDAETSLSITLECQAGEVRFWYKTSCEEGWDFLRFHIDGQERSQWSGLSDWQEVSFPVQAGQRTFTWTYIKDSSSADGQDTVWIDDVTFPQLQHISAVVPTVGRLRPTWISGTGYFSRL